MSESVLEFSFGLSGVPPSMNTMGSRGHWQAFHRPKKQWQADLEHMLMAARLPRLVRVEATAVLTFPDKRRRDSGNFSALLDKALGDALVNGGWLTDDTPEFYRWTNVDFDPERGPRRTRVVLRCWPLPPEALGVAA